MAFSKNSLKISRSKITSETITLVLAPSTLAASATTESVDATTVISEPIVVPVDAEGNYEVEVPAGTDYSLIVNNTGSGTGSKIDDISVSPGEVLIQDITAAEQTLTGGATLRISSLLTGNALEGATVTLLELSSEQQTNVEGIANFTDLPAGIYHIIVSHSDYVNKYLAFSVVSNQVTDLQTIELNNQKGSAVGQISSDSTAELANILVYVRSTDNSVYSTITNASGTFTFPALPVAEGYRFIIVSNLFDSAKSDEVSVLKNQTTIVETIELTERTDNLGTLTGYVKFAEKTELQEHAGILISIEGTDKEAISSRDGSFIINGLAAGTYQFNFTEANHQSTSQSIEITADTTVNLELVELTSLNGNLTGRIIDNNAQPLANVSVLIHETGEVTITDSSGNFIFSDHPIGTYTLITNNQGYGAIQIEITISQANTTTLDIIELTPFVFSGKISLGNQQADHSGVSITLSGTGLTEQTNDDGSFAFYAVEQGNYQLQISRAGYQSQAISIAISADSSELGYTINMVPMVGIVAGQVSLNNRIDHSGIEVKLIDTEYSAFTDSTGKWSLSLPLGNFSNGISYNKGFYLQQINSQTITITENGQFILSPVKLVQNNANVAFNVSAANTCSGNLIVSALGLSGLAEGYSGNLSVDESGAISQALPLGEYQFTTSCSDSGWETSIFNLTLSDTQDSYQLEGINLRQSFLIINDGADYTNDHTVTLALGNTDAVQMRIVDGINDSGWITFAANYNHTLSIGDGLKTVTVKFKDIGGVELSSVSDTIQLDTFLNIAYFNQSGASTKGDLLHLELSLSQELGATVTVTISGIVQALPLLDNGFGGDTVPNDGIYERDFYIDTPIDVNLPIVATITDLSGNSSTVESATNLVLNTAPTIKNLTNSSNIAAGVMTLNFSTDEPATASLVYGDNLANLTNEVEISNNLTKTHTVQLNGLSANSMTYYRITVADSANNKTELEGQGKLAPAAVTGLAAYAGNNEVGLIWDVNVHATGYRIYRSTDGGNVFTVINASELISERFYVDALATNDTELHYRVTAVDGDNNESEEGDSVKVKPEVSLAGPTEIAGGLIDVNTVWLKSRSPYNISANIKVKKDIELLLLPGTAVAFTQANLSIYLAGTISALGQVDNLVKISAFDSGSSNYSGAIIYEQGNNLKSQFTFSELNYLKAYYDYESVYDRKNYLVPLSLEYSVVNIFVNYSFSDFYIKSISDSTVNLLGQGYNDSYYASKINTVKNVVFTSSGYGDEGEVIADVQNSVHIVNAVDATFGNIALYSDYGSIDNSQFTNATINSASSLTNSTLTNSVILGSNSLRAHANTLTNTQVNLSGDNTKLTMHYSTLDSTSTVSAKLLDVSHNYWGTTDLTTIINKTGYSPDQSKNTHLYPIITTSSLYEADWDNDSIPDYLDYDNDNDGYSDLQEDWQSDPLFGSIYNPLDAESHPATDKDNDMDGIADTDDLDDDNDGLLDSDELIRLTDKFLADSDGDGINDGDEVSYKYNPLDKANFPLMGNISGKTINNSNVNSEGVVYIVGYKQSNNNGEEWTETVSLTNVTVAAGTALMIEKDTHVNFNDSVIAGDKANVVTIRSTGAGDGSIIFNNTKVKFANIKVAINLNVYDSSVIKNSDLFLSAGLYNSGLIQNSAITSTDYWNNTGTIDASFISGGYLANQGAITKSYINSNHVSNESDISQSYINTVNANNNSQINGSVIDYLSAYNDASRISNSDIHLEYGDTMNIFFDDVYLSLGYENSTYAGYGDPLDQIGDGVAETVFSVDISDGGSGMYTQTWTIDGINNPRSTPNFPDVVFKPYLEANGIWSPKNVGAWWDMNNANIFPDSDPSTNMGTISGQVQLEGFTNHSGVNVEIMNTSLSTVTDAEGNWSIRVPARDYSNGISFTKAHIQTITKNRSYTVVALQDSDIGILDMSQATATVTGALAIDEATDYTLATITASKNGQSTVINPSTSGEFKFDALILGDYSFAITYPNGSWETVNHALTLSAGDTEYTLPVTRVRNSFVYINDGSAYTNSTVVSLAITNANATNMVVTENSVALPPEVFSATKAITLSTGDGEKTVQVDFTDIDSNALTQAVTTIILDTQVSLTNLTLSTVTTMGDTLHIALTANETSGLATVTIPGLFTDLALYDNGTHGDITADDGVYETDYLITSAEDITATATANFVDRASNVATIDSATDIAIATSPTISDLLVQSSNGKLVISFNTNELVTATINYGTSSDNLDQSMTISASEQLEHIIELAAVEGQSIYFTVTTDDGVTSVTEFTSAGLLAEAAVTGLNISAGNGEVGLVWSKQDNATAYRIYRSDDSNSFTELAEITAATPYYVDTSVYNEQAYNYRITWVDVDGAESDQSNSVIATASIDNAGATELNGGVIAVNEIWLASRSPYIITGNMLIKDAATLSLMPGTEIEFNGAKRHIMVQGNIMAYGSADALVKISTDPVYNYSGGENGEQSAIIYDTANNTASEFNYTELNYLEIYKDYTEFSDRHYNPVNIALNDSVVNGYFGYYSSFYINSMKNSTFNEFGEGNPYTYTSYGLSRIVHVDNVTFNKLDSYSGEPSATSRYIARIDNANNSTFNGAKFYFQNGSIDNSTFNNSTAERAGTITNTTFTNSKVTGENSLRLTESNLINTDVILTGDTRRLTMHYSVLDADSSVSASLLDISYNYWGSTDLTAIAQQTGYSPDKANDTHLYPIITSSSLYLADWDNDSIPDYLDYDNDNDGYSDLQEDWESDPVYGAIFNPLDDTSYPSVATDNDMDGLTDDDDLDDDNDGLLDTDEVGYGTDPFLADSDGDGVNDGDEVRYNYNPLDKTNFPLMGNISGKTIDNSNASSDGVVYLVGYEYSDGMSVQPVQLTNVTVSAGTSIMINKDTPVYFNDSVIAGDADNIVIIRSSGAGNGSFNLRNTQVNFANIKLAISWNIDSGSVVERSDLSLNTDGYNNGTITNSFITTSSSWSNNGVIAHSYISGSYFYNQNQGVIQFSIINLSTNEYMNNYGSINNSYISNRTYQRSSSTITDSIIDKLWSGSDNSQVINSDIQFYSTNGNFPMFLDNSFIADPSGSNFYDGYGSPVDQLGDGVAETVFNLNGYNYTVDGINNPRSTKNFPNGVDDIWIPEGVGALWDKDAADLTVFPEPTP